MRLMRARTEKLRGRPWDDQMTNLSNEEAEGQVFIEDQKRSKKKLAAAPIPDLVGIGFDGQRLENRFERSPFVSLAFGPITEFTQFGVAKTQPQFVLNVQNNRMQSTTEHVIPSTAPAAQVYYAREHVPNLHGYVPIPLGLGLQGNMVLYSKAINPSRPGLKELNDVYMDISECRNLPGDTHTQGRYQIAANLVENQGFRVAVLSAMEQKLMIDDKQHWARLIVELDADIILLDGITKTDALLELMVQAVDNFQSSREFAQSNGILQDEADKIKEYSWERLEFEWTSQSRDPMDEIWMLFRKTTAKYETRRVYKSPFHGEQETFAIIKLEKPKENEEFMHENFAPKVEAFLNDPLMPAKDFIKQLEEVSQRMTSDIIKLKHRFYPERQTLIDKGIPEYEDLSLNSKLQNDIRTITDARKTLNIKFNDFKVKGRTIIEEAIKSGDAKRCQKILPRWYKQENSLESLHVQYNIEENGEVKWGLDAVESYCKSFAVKDWEVISTDVHQKREKLYETEFSYNKFELEDMIIKIFRTYNAKEKAEGYDNFDFFKVLGYCDEHRDKYCSLDNKEFADLATDTFDIQGAKIKDADCTKCSRIFNLLKELLDPQVIGATKPDGSSRPGPVLAPIFWLTPALQMKNLDQVNGIRMIILTSHLVKAVMKATSDEMEATICRVPYFQYQRAKPATSFLPQIVEIRRLAETKKWKHIAKLDVSDAFPSIHPDVVEFILKWTAPIMYKLALPMMRKLVTIIINRRNSDTDEFMFKEFLKAAGWWQGLSSGPWGWVGTQWLAHRLSQYTANLFVKMDDYIVVAKTAAELDEIIESVEKELALIGIRLNVNKTQKMKISDDVEAITDCLSHGGEVIGERITHLGAEIYPSLKLWPMNAIMKAKSIEMIEAMKLTGLSTSIILEAIHNRIIPRWKSKIEVMLDPDSYSDQAIVLQEMMRMICKVFDIKEEEVSLNGVWILYIDPYHTISNAIVKTRDPRPKTEKTRPNVESVELPGSTDKQTVQYAYTLMGLQPSNPATVKISFKRRRWEAALAHWQVIKMSCDENIVDPALVKNVQERVIEALNLDVNDDYIGLGMGMDLENYTEFTNTPYDWKKKTPTGYPKPSGKLGQKSAADFPLQVPELMKWKDLKDIAPPLKKEQPKRLRPFEDIEMHQAPRSKTYHIMKTSEEVYKKIKEAVAEALGGVFLGKRKDAAINEIVAINPAINFNAESLTEAHKDLESGTIKIATMSSGDKTGESTNWRDNRMKANQTSDINQATKEWAASSKNHQQHNNAGISMKSSSTSQLMHNRIAGPKQNYDPSTDKIWSDMMPNKEAWLDAVEANFKVETIPDYHTIFSWRPKLKAEKDALRLGFQAGQGRISGHVTPPLQQINYGMFQGSSTNYPNTHSGAITPTGNQTPNQNYKRTYQFGDELKFNQFHPQETYKQSIDRQNALMNNRLQGQHQANTPQTNLNLKVPNPNSLHSTPPPTYPPMTSMQPVGPLFDFSTQGRGAPMQGQQSQTISSSMMQMLLEKQAKKK